TYAGTNFAIRADGTIVVAQGGLTAGNFTLYVKITDHGGNGYSIVKPVNVVVNGQTGTAPVIQVTGAVTFATPDNVPTRPLQNLTFVDADDLANNRSITVTVTFDGTHGDFVGIPSNLPTGITAIAYTLHGNSLVITGLQGDVTTFLHSLRFDPRDKAAAAGTTEATDFAVQIRDSSGTTSNIVDVTVTATATNSAPTN
ncbi:hypothetical protein HI113_43920, partial [Corallococcus exiguus]|uniref:hypothetical protein n=1 Tax=Corallococcus exiguus TaxID=83462 RepID=UPI001473092F